MRAVPFLTTLAAGFALALAACQSSNDTTQGSARDLATTHTCDKYDSCMQIGAGKKYETRTSCEIDQRAAWENMWPPAQCDGMIDVGNFSLCLSAIDAVACGNLLDILNVYANKCTKAMVCGKPDGG